MKFVSIPFSGGGLGHGNGACEAPSKIRERLKECFANERGHTPTWEYQNVLVDEAHVGYSHKQIQDYFSSFSEKACLVGGDHSITCPILTGLVQGGYLKNPWFVVFDAHPDLMDDFRPPTQEDYLRVLIESGVLQSERIIIIGVRNWDKQEIDYLREKKIRYYTAAEIFEKGVQSIASEVVSFIDGPFYLSLDIDVVDPVEAIGTGYLEHGGLSSREFLYFVEQLRKTGNIAMVDLVEVNPTKDVRDITTTLAAKILTELSDY